MTEAARPLRLALLGESLVDESALAILVEAALGRPFVRVQPRLRARGWPSVLQTLPAIARHLHFHTDADGIVVLVDSDDTEPHPPAHDAPGYFHPRCRLCQLRAAFRRATKNLPPAHGRTHLLRAIGLAVPAAEAWYLCGLDDRVGEAAWSTGRAAGTPPYTRRELKQLVYGTDRPNLPQAVAGATAAARRHARDLRRLENDFPGFATLARDLRTWPTPDASSP
ncbi:MAG: hypothetical protein MUE42_13010 [Opitutaceae bacterium]|jgi:hypothetical protein|nr:hypothetical protein [Opitutaceae bacterium]